MLDIHGKTLFAINILEMSNKKKKRKEVTTIMTKAALLVTKVTSIVFGIEMTITVEKEDEDEGIEGDKYYDNNNCGDY